MVSDEKGRTRQPLPTPISVGLAVVTLGILAVAVLSGSLFLGLFAVAAISVTVYLLSLFNRLVIAVETIAAKL